MKFQIFKASPLEAKEISILDKEIWDNFANPVPLYRQLMEIYPHSVFLGRSEDGTLAGFSVGLYNPLNNEAWLLSIDLAARFRSQGLGKQLLKEVLDCLLDQGAKKITAIIDVENLISQKLFKGFGFQKIKIEDNYFFNERPQERWELNK